MTTRYIDPAAGGLGDGTSWTNAFTTLQAAADVAVAGDVVYCRGTETLAARVDFDTNSGTNAEGWIKFIGCNAAGNVDGTRYVIDGNSGNYAGVYCAVAYDMYWFENIEIQNCDGGSSGTGFHVGTAYNAGVGCVFINCCSHGNYIGFTVGTNNLSVRCVAYGNTGNGWNAGGASFVVCSAAIDNGGSGFFLASGSANIAPIAHGNTDDGIATANQFVFGGTIDGNGDDGIFVPATAAVGFFGRYIGCRITNHSGAGDIGLNANSEPCVTGWCYFEDNDGDNIQNATLHSFIPNADGTTTNIEDQANTNEGYTAAGTDFNLRSDASLRRTAITIPLS